MRPTFGYLDAGTGSIVVQMFLGAIAANVVTVRLWSNAVLRLLRLGPLRWRVLAGHPASEDALRAGVR